MKMWRNFGLIFLVLLLAVPVMAQGEDPVMVTLQDNAVELVMGIVILGLLIVLGFAIQRLGVSVPQETTRDYFNLWDKSTDKLIEKFGTAADMTTSPVDNFAVDGASLIKQFIEDALRGMFGIPEEGRTGEAQKVVYQVPGGAEVTIERIEDGAKATAKTDEPKG
ncbi:hypothetical protein G4Y79_15355 [Phototrophicus methaneseepsis]|uniref:Uncharacterized protein n=1 Tax=Phototrophicus methaneseepsis TaxID=2710758 RepID=A0A7S8E670_9CHLR|nr:hypothetical protein [Phototrophicus methaneseepsis]QPC81080.1 hypothetical protein G4Y79_15355 [Phototrophicus methaneseepsis]